MTFTIAEILNINTSSWFDCCWAPWWLSGLSLASYTTRSVIIVSHSVWIQVLLQTRYTSNLKKWKSCTNF